MKPIKTKNTNTIFTAENCEDLPATIFQYADGRQAVETCWELSADDLEVVKRTGKVYLSVIGGQPPVKLAVVSDLDDPNTDGGNEA